MMRLRPKLRPNRPKRNIKLKGLCPDKKYQCEELGMTLSGRTLMTCGIDIGLHGDYASATYYFKAEG